ncbi:MAG: hypothetical protein RJA57_1745 [Bacteroidota bacterium]
MKVYVRISVFITCLLIQCLLPARSQLRLTPPHPLTGDMRRVIGAYPSGFRSITGELLEKNQQSAEYRSTFLVSGATESTVTRHYGEPERFSWQALLLRTEDFDKARRTFRQRFGQLDRLTSDGVRFVGTYETPEEGKKFTSVLFSPDTDTGPMRDLRMELQLQFRTPMEWEIRVLVYDVAERSATDQ